MNFKRDFRTKEVDFNIWQKKNGVMVLYASNVDIGITAEGKENLTGNLLDVII